MYGYIYKTTNLLNNKIYIGQKKSNEFLHEKYLGSGKYLLNSIRKHGKENFKVELIDTANSKEELSQLEIYYISKYNATDVNIGYNIAKGGIGGGEVYVNNGIKNEFIQKCNLERYLNSGWELGMIPGRKEINHSKTRGINISKALKNVPKSEEQVEKHKQSLLSAHRHWYTSGIIGDNILTGENDVIPDGYYPGRTFSEEFKKKCGEKNIGKSAWNKGLTKETDERVKKYSEQLKHFYKQKEG